MSEESVPTSRGTDSSTYTTTDLSFSSLITSNDSQKTAGGKRKTMFIDRWTDLLEKCEIHDYWWANTPTIRR